MAAGGVDAPSEPKPKRGVSWRLWAVLVVVVVVIVAGVAYYLTRPAGRDTKTLVYYIQSEPVSMDPSDAYDLWSSLPLLNIYDTVLTYNKDTTQLIPGLATVVPTVANGEISADGLRYTFHIRNDVKFCDGNSLTAWDVYASIRKILVEASPESGVAWIINQTLNPNDIPGSLWVKDTYTIQMNLTAPYVAFLTTVAAVEPAGIMESAFINASGGVQHWTPNPTIKQNTMGTGPYCMQASDWVHGSQMTLHQNKYYWGGWHGTEPTTVVIKFTTDASSRVEAIRTGAADVADLPLSSISQVSSMPGVIAKANDTIKSEIVTFNVTNPFLADNASGRLVRQALSWAFDYNATIAQDYAGYASLLPGPIPNGMPYYNVEHQVYYQDLTKAAQLLDAAGYVKNNAGVRFGGAAFRLVADGTQVEEANAARRFQNTLNSLGIVTNLIITPSTEAWDTIRSRGAYDLFTAHWVLDYLDPDDYVSPMDMNATNGGDYWHTGFNNLTTNTYGYLARSELNPTARAADYAQVFAAATTNPNMIWFCQQLYVPIHQSYIHNFWFGPILWYQFYAYQKT